MQSRRPRAFSSLLRIAALASLAAFPAVPAPQAAKRLAADTPRTTSAGATFSAPAGWSLASHDTVVLLDAPEQDSHVAIVETTASDASAAVAAAWAAYRPSAHRTLKLATPAAPRNGWDDRRIFDYETSPNERAVVQALALRAHNAWTVVIIDGTEPTFEKRGSQLALVLDSLRPKGYERESFAHRPAHPLDAARIAQLKSFLAASMDELGVPGAGLALIDNGKVVYEGGLGVRQLGKPTPVDANTLFMAASNTKGMTTLLLALEADEGKLRWDQPVTQLYPSFRLGDDATTRQVLVKHLICACTGLPRQDLEWLFEFKNSTPASSLALLGTMKPTSRFGELFQYSNLMAAAAGYIGAHLDDAQRDLGPAYDSAMRKRIFVPLGMNSTTFDFDRALHANHATPHGDDVDGHPSVAEMALNYSVVPLRPAGGVWTSAHDLSRYVQLELGRGALDGKRIVSEENILMRRKPQVAIGEDEYYGMGLMIDTTWGVTVVHHGGSLIGFKSDLMFLPDQGIGAVVLTNSDTGSMLLRPFMRRLLEVVFDGKPEAAADIDSRAARYKAFLAQERKRLAVPAASAAAARLAPHYTNAALGDLTVLRQGPDTVFDFGEWKSRVASRANDDGTTSFVTIDPGETGFEFVLAERSGKRALIIRDGQHEYVFLETV